MDMSSSDEEKPNNYDINIKILTIIQNGIVVMHV